MTFTHASQIISKAGLRNNVYSINDNATTNIGHTVPWFDKSPTNNETAVLRNGSPQQIADLVSNKRQFVNSVETAEIVDGTTFTVEPRLSGENFPMVNFHLVIGFEDGQRTILADFNPLFELFEMEDLCPSI